jgi:hypothetical protein
LHRFYIGFVKDNFACGQILLIRQLENCLAITINFLKSGTENKVIEKVITGHLISTEACISIKSGGQLMECWRQDMWHNWHIITGIGKPFQWISSQWQ